MRRLAPIRTSADHDDAMRRVTELFDAVPGTPEADELDVLVTLIERYERASIPAPSPLDAIRFRMEQEGLSARDLEPYLGSRSRVSEILSGERTLTIDMMRALNRHLGIPAEALLGASLPADLETTAEPSGRALQKLVDAGFLRAGEAFAEFVARGFGGAFRPAMLRKTRTERTNAKTDIAALQGWSAAALLASRTVHVSAKPEEMQYDQHMGRELAKLSAEPDGLRSVRGFLAQRGVALVFLEHLPGTYLDGAAMLRDDGVSVIALTLRHNRIDNFWFTLLHEFAHVACHLSEDTSMILDDLEIRSADTIEEEADRFAQRALIPDRLCSALKRSDFEIDDVHKLSRKAGVHPAIVAGRWQREHRDYRKFSKLVGHGEVRDELKDFLSSAY